MTVYHPCGFWSQAYNFSSTGFLLTNWLKAVYYEHLYVTVQIIITNAFYSASDTSKLTFTESEPHSCSESLNRWHKSMSRPDRVSIVTERAIKA